MMMTTTTTRMTNPENDYRDANVADDLLARRSRRSPRNKNADGDASANA